ncbi:MAG: hypothetical protein ISS25_03290 [Nanoarchaeota archaeon]|nr:hypothetical protein [DPANN group archaeon]MBL7116826.1 hypothetical protein [Nanoarchaeota archaeon]
MQNQKGSIIGLIIGFILGAISFGVGMFALFFLFPIYGLIWAIVGCAGEDCWGFMIMLSPVILGLTGMLIGAYLQNKRTNQR